MPSVTVRLGISFWTTTWHPLRATDHFSQLRDTTLDHKEERYDVNAACRGYGKPWKSKKWTTVLCKAQSGCSFPRNQENVCYKMSCSEGWRNTISEIKQRSSRTRTKLSAVVGSSSRRDRSPNFGRRKLKTGCSGKRASAHRRWT